MQLESQRLHPVEVHAGGDVLHTAILHCRYLLTDADEAGITVTFHISKSGFNEMYSSQWENQPDPGSSVGLPMDEVLWRPADHAEAEWHDLLQLLRTVPEHPGDVGGKRLAVVPYFVKAMDKMKGMGRNGPWPGGYLAGKPSEVLREKVFVSPDHEGDVVALAETVGVSQVVFGSDYPYTEGLARPLDFREGLAGLSDLEQDLIMGENLAALAVRPA